jgi:putative ABC transport system permease protein
MVREYRYAIRSLMHQPGLTIAAIAALGLALGASATIFGLIDGLWLRPPGATAPAELVRVFAVTTDTHEGGWSYPEVLDLQASAKSLSHVVARGQRGSIVPDANNEPVLVLVNVVSPNFFEAMGVHAAIGRLPGWADREPVVALGHTYWRTRFAGDPAVVGRTVPLGTQGAVTATIIGVLPESFRDLEPAADRDLWMPPVTWMRLTDASEFEDRASRWFQIVGRRAPGRTTAQVDAELQVLVSGLAVAGPGDPARRARVISDRDHRLESGGGNIMALLALVGIVGLITCANLAELLLAGVAKRRQDFATRVALGASPARLAGGLVAEGTLLGLGGCVVAVVVTLALMQIVPAVIVPPPGFRSFLVVMLDGRVAAFLAIAALLFTGLFSMAPARLAARTDLIGLIKTTGTRTTTGLALQVAQIALAFVLLSAAAVLARSFAASQSGSFGLTESPVLTAWSLNDLPPATRAVAESRLRALNGVRDVALAIRAPLSLSGSGRAAAVRLPGAGTVEMKYNAVSANYFSVIGTPIIEGRSISDDDERSRQRVAVINETLAAQWPGGRSALGERFQIGAGGNEAAWEVVGVAADAAISEIGEAPEPYLYLPFDTFGPGEVTFLIALRDDAVVPVREVRSVLIGIDRTLEPRRLVMMREYVHYATRDFRATATLASTLGALGLLLTLVGVYGVTAFRSSRRLREFGIRTALGATRRQVLVQVLREELGTVAMGIGVGLVAALWSNRILESLLLGVMPWDPWSLIATTVLLVVCLTSATIGPALRAASVDPSEALRNA